MGVDNYHANQTSWTIFRVAQSAAPEQASNQFFFLLVDAPGMGVSAYQTRHQTSRTTSRAPRSAAPRPGTAPSAEYRPSALKCRSLDHVPPLDWVPPPVRCRHLSKI